MILHAPLHGFTSLHLRLTLAFRGVCPAIPAMPWAVVQYLKPW